MMVINSYFRATGDTDVAAFLTATGITDGTQVSAYTTLVTSLKAYGLWTKILAFWPFLGGTATTHKYNGKDPQDLDTSFRLTFFGGITHDANGVTGNGSTGYYNTHIIPSTNLSKDNVSAFVYLRTNYAGGVVDFGPIKQGAPQYRLQINPRNGTNFFASALSDTSISNTASTDSRGLMGLSRTGSTSYLQSVNSTQTTITSTSSGQAPVKMYGLAFNTGANVAGVFSTRNQAFACVGSGLTASECDDLYTIVQAYQTSLSRNV